MGGTDVKNSKKMLLILAMISLSFGSALAYANVNFKNNSNKDFIFRVRFFYQDLNRKLNPQKNFLYKTNFSQQEYDAYLKEKGIYGAYEKRYSVEVTIPPQKNVLLDDFSSTERIEYKEGNKWLELSQNIFDQIFKKNKSETLTIEITRNWFSGKIDFKVPEKTKPLPKGIYASSTKAVLSDIIAAKTSLLYEKLKKKYYSDFYDTYFKNCLENKENKEISKQNKCLTDLLNRIEDDIRYSLFKIPKNKPEFEKEFPFLYSDTPSDKEKTNTFIMREKYAQAKMALDEYYTRNVEPKVKQRQEEEKKKLESATNK